MKIGIVTISAELIDSMDLKLIGKIKRKDISMKCAGAFDVLLESEYFRDIEDGALIPNYDILISNYNGAYKVESVTEL